ncbi:hypothetical protein L6452_22266 [Arctium lappa]|uniref:Uncharacterized protein n=1 Tax=Arctium lappa TaxID=4217 RepID=A0ACB9AYH7_ARCLA|nr:hypothetical protein L6452_22266 [Arctium lappa]
MRLRNGDRGRSVYSQPKPREKLLFESNRSRIESCIRMSICFTLHVTEYSELSARNYLDTSGWDSERAMIGVEGSSRVPTTGSTGSMLESGKVTRNPRS